MREYIVEVENGKILNALEPFNGVPRFEGWVNGKTIITGEVIRCKDCVDYKDYEDMGFKFRLSDGQCRRYGCAVDKKDFCSHAVMEEE